MTSFWKELRQKLASREGRGLASAYVDPQYRLLNSRKSFWKVKALRTFDKQTSLGISINTSNVKTTTKTHLRHSTRHEKKVKRKKPLCTEVFINK